MTFDRGWSNQGLQILMETILVTWKWCVHIQLLVGKHLLYSHSFDLKDHKELVTTKPNILV